MNKIETFVLDKLLSVVNKPYQYIGNEMFSYNKSFEESKVRFAIAFPDKYEVGASNLGHRVLYEAVSSIDDCLCDRAYAPESDCKKAMGEMKIPLYGLESKFPLKEFDFLGFSLQYELCYPTVLAMLEMSGIPIRNNDRDDSHPVILAGGPCAFNPEPLKDFVDAFLIGDGEQSCKEIAEAFINLKIKGNTSRHTVLEVLSGIDGIYVPSIHQNSTVNKRIFNFDIAMAPKIHPVPFSTSIHDRAVVEIRRGCGRMCRFCQPGHVNLPIRERKAKDIINLTKELVHNTGYDEFSMLSLSSNDYTNIEPVLEELTCYFKDKKVSASLPSQRIDRFNIRLSNLVKDVRKTTITLAPEAGSQRLRDVINKNLSEEQIINTTLECYKNGYDSIKFYFILGLPTETYEDIDEMLNLLNRIKYRAKIIKNETGLKQDLKLNCTLSIFVPKPFTPFQWCGQDSIEDITEKIHYIKERPIKGVRIKIHDKYISQIESVLARGDSSLCNYIEALFKEGCYLDAWDECFDKRVWDEAAQKCGLDLKLLAQAEFDVEDVLPWDFINTGIKKEWLVGEYKKALQSKSSVPCETACSNCGICSAFNVKKHLDAPYTPQCTANIDSVDKKSKKYRVTVSKKGYLKYLSHLDWQNTLVKALFRSGLKIVFTEGFNPIPKISLGVALPIFVESDGEFLEFEIYDDMEPDKIKEILNKSLDKNARIIKICEIEKSSKSLDTIVQWARYEFVPQKETIPKNLDLGYIKKVLSSGDEIFLKKKSKKGIDKLISVNQSLKDVEVFENKICLTLKAGQNQVLPSIRPDDLIKFFYPDTRFNIKRLAFFDENMNRI